MSLQRGPPAPAWWQATHRDCLQWMGSMCLSCCWWVQLHVHLHLLLHLYLCPHFHAAGSRLCSLQREVENPKPKAKQKTALILPWAPKRICGTGVLAPLPPLTAWGEL